MSSLLACITFGQVLVSCLEKGQSAYMGEHSHLFSPDFEVVVTNILAQPISTRLDFVRASYAQAKQEGTKSIYALYMLKFGSHKDSERVSRFLLQEIEPIRFKVLLSELSGVRLDPMSPDSSVYFDLISKALAMGPDCYLSLGSMLSETPDREGRALLRSLIAGHYGSDCSEEYVANIKLGLIDYLLQWERKFGSLNGDK
jgi:hypothetical protein